MVAGPFPSNSVAKPQEATPLPPGGSLLRGNIIGGTALIDDVANKPYPNEVVLTARSKYVEWPLAELRQCAEILPR